MKMARCAPGPLARRGPSSQQSLGRVVRTATRAVAPAVGGSWSATSIAATGSLVSSRTRPSCVQSASGGARGSSAGRSGSGPQFRLGAAPADPLVPGAPPPPPASTHSVPQAPPPPTGASEPVESSASAVVWPQAARWSAHHQSDLRATAADFTLPRAKRQTCGDFMSAVECTPSREDWGARGVGGPGNAGYEPLPPRRRAGDAGSSAGRDEMTCFANDFLEDLRKCSLCSAGVDLRTWGRDSTNCCGMITARPRERSPRFLGHHGGSCSFLRAVP